MAINVAKVAGRLNDITDKSLEFLTFWSKCQRLPVQVRGMLHQRTSDDYDWKDSICW